MGKEFNLTEALKRQTLSSARFAAGGMAAMILTAYDAHYGDFGTLQFGDLVWGGTAGVLASVTWDSVGQVVKQISMGVAQGRAARARQERPYANAGRAPIAPTRGGRVIPASSGMGTRQMAFDYQSPPTDFYIQQSAPGFINRERWGEMVKRWLGWGDARPVAGPVQVSPEVRVRPRPAEMDDLKFWSYDHQGNWIQLLGGDVWKFLKIAWRKREGGSGLGERRWGKRGRRDWPEWYHGLETPWYWSMIRLLDESERMTGVQVVMVTGHRWKALKYDGRRTYDLLCKAEELKRFDINGGGDEGQQRIREGTD